MLANALQHIYEIIVGIDIVQPTGRQQALHNADVPRAQLSPAEQPVLFAHRDDPQRAFAVVRVDRYLRIVQVDRQADPTLTDIRQRTEEGTARQEAALVELLVEPGEETLEDGFRLLLSASELGLPRHTIVANLLLDLVESGNRVQCLVGLRRLDIPSVKDFTACMSPALCVCDPRLLRVMLIGAVAVALQYGAIGPLQAKRGLDVLGRTAGRVWPARRVRRTTGAC